MRLTRALSYRDDDEPEDGLTYDERLVRHCCETSESPLYRLEEHTVSFLRHHTNAQIKLLIPRNVDRWDWDEYMSDGHSRLSFMRPEALESTLERYEQRMMKGTGPREGSMKFINHREMLIRPGNRRYPSITHEQTAEGIFYHQHTSPSPWHWYEPCPNFYTDCIAPHLPKEEKTDPFGWALERLKIVHGYGEAFCGHDNAPDYMEHPYKEMAGRACNLLPDCLRLPRKYAIDDRKNALLEKAKVLCPLPDAACIVLENADTLDEMTLDDPAVKLFFEELPRMLENGFVLDRFTETVRAQRASGLDAQNAVRFAAQLVCSMYRGQLIPLKPEEGGPFYDKKPWWFRENIDLVSMQDDETRAQEKRVKGECVIPFDNAGRAILLKIAEAGSFATEYLLETYRAIGHKLAAMEGVGEDTAIDLCSEVVWEYGIGNPGRAIRTLEYAVILAEEAPPEQRAEVLENLFLSHVLRERPGTPIIAALETEDASVSFSGLLPLLHSILGGNRMEKDKALIANTRPEQIRDLTALLYTSPQQRRACAQIAFDPETGYEQHRLLPQANRGSPHLRLPAPEKQKLLGGNVVAPCTGLFGFYKQLREECEGDYESAALLYLSVCAPRMRDPFHPPKGFLGLLQKYHSIPVVTNEDIGKDLFRAPWDNHRSRSSERRCDQAMTLSHLMDAMVMGAISEEELVETLRWLTVNATPEEEKECCWTVHEEGKEWRTGRKMYSMDEDGKEVEHIEEKDEDRELDWRIANAIRETAGKERHKRLESIAAVLGNGMFLTQIIGKNGIRKEDVLPILHAAILRWKTGALPPDLREGTDEWGHRERLDGLKTCLDAGILDSTLLLRDFRQAVETGVGIADLLASLPGTAEALHRSRERIGHFQRGVSNLMTPGKDPTAIVRQELDWLRNELKREYWGGDIPPLYVLPNVVDRLLATTSLPYVTQVELAMRGSMVEAALLPPQTGALQLQQEGMESQAASGEEPPATYPGAPVSMADIASATRGSLKTALLLGVPLRPALSHGHTKRFARARRNEEDFALSLTLPSPEVVALVRRIEKKFEQQGPEIREKIRNWRLAARGLLPVGGKVHVEREFKEDDMTLLQAFVGERQYDNSGFHLIHAARALLLPPRPSVEEWEETIALLIQQNTIRDRHPQLQIGLPGRIVPEHCGHLAVSALLTTSWSARFTEDAFKSSHDHATGARMIAYDAGAPNAALPFMMRRGNANLKGRTDVLGRRHPEDARVIQLVGTVLVDLQTDGPFAALGAEYMQRLEAILHHHGIAGVLNAPWVFRTDAEKHSTDDATSLAHFHDGVKPCQDRYFACAETYRERTKKMGPDAPREGIIFDVRANVDWLRREVENHQPTAIDSDPRFKEHLRYLLHV